MKRLVLRKGFTLRAHEGVGHLTDVRTGDALLVPGSELVLLEAAALNGVDPGEPTIAALLVRYGPFLEAAPELVDRAFYELDLDDAPNIPPVRREELERPRVVATVATPSAASGDWQLHGDGPKRAEVPSPLPQPDPDNPWKVRGASAPSVYSLPAPGSSESPVPMIAPVRPSPAGPGDSAARRASPSGRWPAASAESGSSVSPVPTIAPADLVPRRGSPSGTKWPAAAAPTEEARAPLADQSADSASRRVSPSGTKWPAAAPPTEEARAPLGDQPADSASRRVSPSGTKWPAASPTEEAREPADSASRRVSPSGTKWPAVAARADQSRESREVMGQAAGLGAVAAASQSWAADGSVAPAAVQPPGGDLSAAEELSRALAASERELNQTAREPTRDGQHLEQVLASGASSTPATAEDELRRALEGAQQPPPAEAPPPADPANFLSQEDNLRQALDQAAPPPSREDVAALLASTAKELGVTAAPPLPAAPSPAAQPGRAATLVAGGVAVLALTVAVSLWLRARSDGDDLDLASDAGAVLATRPVEVDAGAVVAKPIDGGANVVAAKPDAGLKTADVAQPLDAGARAADAASAPDAGAAKTADAAKPPDAGGAKTADAAKPPDAGVTKTDGWLEGPVQTRGRVKMADLKARADGVVSWAVTAEQRVKSKQVIGKLTRADGSTQDLVAESVGLAMLDVAEGAQVKAGASLAQVIYFEAWAKAVVKGLPTPAWRCEVVSESAGQRAECKVSVVTPRPGGGAQVTVAIEPRWFDGAADAVLRLAP